MADGQHVRSSGIWTKDKLLIVEQYAAGFANACRYKARRFFFVDGFCGPGLNLIRETDETVLGSPLLALRTFPGFDKCIFVDQSRPAITALRARTQGFGKRAVIVEGDCNKDLVPAMRTHIPSWAPVLCLLDPEGPDLHWSTVEDISSFREGKTKVEQLILLPTHTGFLRELFLDKPLPWWAAKDMNQVFGNEKWRRIYHDRRAGAISSEVATNRYVRLYADGLRRLGYRVLDREIRAGGEDGRLLYFLIFATEHDKGLKIMSSVFNKVAPRPIPMNAQFRLDLGLKWQRRSRLEDEG